MTLKRLSEFGLSLVLSLSSLLVVAVPKVHAETAADVTTAISMNIPMLLMAALIYVAMIKNLVKTYSHSTTQK